ncbi:protein kinase domain-containing protein [Paludisphaera borealis]|nr:protein kinase [Paludisphaera borealis]
MKAEPERAKTEETMPWSDASGVEERDLTGRVLGDFQVERFIGRGGMGEVYLAKQVSLNRHVAVKVLLPEWVSRPAYLSRFGIEATAVAKLNHANIVQVYTLGCVDDIHFIAMEYVQGTNLREYLLKKGSLDLPLALSIMRQAGHAIGAAGEVGLIHRDIKPENLLLTRKGRIKVADFGLCRDMDSDRHHVTQHGTTMGTPLYMSPEQAQGHAMDHRSDLYSLGVTFYHMIVGEPPFRAESTVALALKHVREQAPSMRVRRPEVPIELDRLVLKLMAKKPDDRYQSAAEMLVDLAKIRALLQPVASGLMGDITGIAATQEQYEFESRPSTEPRGSKLLSASSKLLSGPLRLALNDHTWFRPGVLGLIAACGLAIGGLLGWQSRSREDAEAQRQAASLPPALGIGPRWASIPKMDNPEAQYRYAQLTAPPRELAAAWLAVPGYFPRSEWTSPAYLQLGRVLYRERDGDRVAALAREINGWKSRQTRDEELVETLETGEVLLKRDLDGVIERVSRIANRTDRPVSDPGLIDFCVEIVTDALKLVSQPGTTGQAVLRPKLTGLQVRLLILLDRVRSLDLAVR